MLIAEPDFCAYYYNDNIIRCDLKMQAMPARFIYRRLENAQASTIIFSTVNQIL